jgi:hypothetical protein
LVSVKKRRRILPLKFSGIPIEMVHALPQPSNHSLAYGGATDFSDSLSAGFNPAGDLFSECVKNVMDEPNRQGDVLHFQRLDDRVQRISSVDFNKVYWLMTTSEGLFGIEPKNSLIS